MNKNYETVSEAINDLVKRGYSTNLSIHTEKDGLICASTSVCLAPGEFQIDEVYRFEGSSDPADEAVVYAIAAPDFKIKGIFVDAFGTYSNAGTSKVMQYLRQGPTSKKS